MLWCLASTVLVVDFDVDLANQHHRLTYHDAFHIWIFGRSYRSANCLSNTVDDLVGVWVVKCVSLPVISVSLLFVLPGFKKPFQNVIPVFLVLYISGSSDAPPSSKIMTLSRLQRLERLKELT